MHGLCKQRFCCRFQADLRGGRCPAVFKFRNLVPISMAESLLFARESVAGRLRTADALGGALPNVFAEVSYLVHFVRRTSTGSELLSRFWLGHIRSRIPIVGGLVSRKLNTPSARIANNPDAFGLRLLRHCSEEMTHLSNILPSLYAAFAKDP